MPAPRTTPIDARSRSTRRSSAAGAPRGSYAALFARVGAGRAGRRARADPRQLEAGAACVFGGAEPRPFDVDPVPRIVEADEWDRLERGLAQRARALNAFLDDVYARAPDRRRRAAAGAELLERAEWFEPAMAGEGDARRRAPTSPDPTWCAAPTASCACSRTTCGRPRGWPTRLAAREAMAPVIEAAGMRAAPARRRDRRARRDAPRRRRPTARATRASSCSTTARTRAPSSSTERWPAGLGMPIATPAELRRRRRPAAARRRRRSTSSTAASTTSG